MLSYTTAASDQHEQDAVQYAHSDESNPDSQTIQVADGVMTVEHGAETHTRAEQAGDGAHSGASINFET